METKSDYADVLIRWNDTGEEETVLFKLSCDYDEESDDNVFFYCNGVEELKSMKRCAEGFEFVVLGYDY